jgi:hypothetical protein
MDSDNRADWLSLFVSDAVLTDDGNEEDFVHWSDNEIFGKGRARLISIDHEDDNGLTLYGTLHSAQWGTFKTFFKFHQRGEKFSRLDVGQIDR